MSKSQITKDIITILKKADPDKAAVALKDFNLHRMSDETKKEFEIVHDEIRDLKNEVVSYQDKTDKRLEVYETRLDGKVPESHFWWGVGVVLAVISGGFFFLWSVIEKGNDKIDHSNSYIIQFIQTVTEVKNKQEVIEQKQAEIDKKQTEIMQTVDGWKLK